MVLKELQMVMLREVELFHAEETEKRFHAVNAEEQSKKRKNRDPSAFSAPLRPLRETKKISRRNAEGQRKQRNTCNKDPLRSPHPCDLCEKKNYYKGYNPN